MPDGFFYVLVLAISKLNPKQIIHYTKERNRLNRLCPKNNETTDTANSTYKLFSLTLRAWFATSSTSHFPSTSLLSSVLEVFHRILRFIIFSNLKVKVRTRGVSITPNKPNLLPLFHFFTRHNLNISWSHMSI